MTSTTNQLASGTAAGDEELRVGDLVVLMLEPGPFRIVEVDKGYLVIEAPTGVRRRVRDIAVRRVTGEPPTAR